MKTSNNSTSTLSATLLTLKSIEAKAVKAAARADNARRAARKQPKPKAAKELPAIELEVRSIINAITSRTTDSRCVTVDRDPKGASCKAIIRIFDADALALHREAMEEYRAKIARGADRTSLPKPASSLPVVMYALYPDPVDSTRLGSIAIYCEDAPIRLTLILKQRTLLGHRVAAATLERGRRPFIDVRLAR
ncbi:MAG: hypothetical protein NC187_02680 [Candidatus Amulumruptor caecigallinarius]|nr:hypothetical protein [Candidatus Amulumruptor caecigallinarius]MCM1396380.1 hypothetical protein [Candidatus Amulumruptor caecigallinarius]MCM1453678.1 hypothetical protein [bacterium]